jgi:hypothetical protein
LASSGQPIKHVPRPATDTVVYASPADRAPGPAATVGCAVDLRFWILPADDERRRLGAGAPVVNPWRSPCSSTPSGSARVAGVDAATAAEHATLQYADGQIARGATTPVHVELVVHLAVALGEALSRKVAALFQHQDVFARFGEQTRSGRAAAAGADDAHVRIQRLGRWLLGQIDDRAFHGVTGRARGPP